MIQCCCGCTVSFTGRFQVGCWVASYPVGATITITDHATPSTTYWTGTTTGTTTTATFSGSFVLASGTSVSVDITCTDGTDTKTQTFTLNCGANSLTTIQIIKVRTTFQINGCNGVGLDGASVTFSGPISGSFTSNSSGQSPTAYDFTPGTYSWTSSKTRFNGSSGSFTITNCTGTGVSAGALTVTITAGSAASGFQCFCASIADPVATTLNGTLQGTSFTATTSGAEWGFSSSFHFPLTSVTSGDCCDVNGNGAADGNMAFCYGFPVRQVVLNITGGFPRCGVVTGTYIGSLTSITPPPSFSATFSLTLTNNIGTCLQVVSGTVSE